MANKKGKVKNRASSHFKNSRKNSTSSQTSSRIFEDAVALAGTLLHSRKAYGAEKLHAIAEATRGYADSMSSLPIISEQVNVASETIEDFADYIVHSNMEQMIEDAGTFARRRPLATLCVTMAAGLAASRMLMPLRQAALPRKKKKPEAPKKKTIKRQSTNGSTHVTA